jgi:nucleotide-binding universal stress UspA family protein
MKTMLVCYEERPVARRVLERAAELAKALDARVLVTSVAPVLGMVPHGTGPYDPVDPPERHDQELADAAAQLAELGLTEVETVTGVGDPAKTIVEIADARSVDLIVLGAHDGGLLSRVFEGSVGDRVAHKAHTDVLIVH